MKFASITQYTYNSKPIQQEMQEDMQESECFRWLPHLKVNQRTKSYLNGCGTVLWTKFDQYKDKNHLIGLRPNFNLFLL